MQDFASGRERATANLAERMFFKLEKHGDRFSLSRKIGGFNHSKTSRSKRSSAS